MASSKLFLNQEEKEATAPETGQRELELRGFSSLAAASHSNAT
jgi:hypothetical protein